MKMKVQEMKDKQKQKNLEGFGSVIIDEDPQDIVNQSLPPVDYTMNDDTSLISGLTGSLLDDTVWKIDVPIMNDDTSLLDDTVWKIDVPEVNKQLTGSKQTDKRRESM